MPSTWLPPTVLGRVLMVETGGAGYLRSPPLIMSLLADLQIAEKIEVGGCCITAPKGNNTRNKTPR